MNIPEFPFYQITKPFFSTFSWYSTLNIILSVVLFYICYLFLILSQAILNSHTTHSFLHLYYSESRLLKLINLNIFSESCVLAFLYSNTYKKQPWGPHPRGCCRLIGFYIFHMLIPRMKVKFCQRMFNPINVKKSLAFLSQQEEDNSRGRIVCICKIICKIY